MLCHERYAAVTVRYPGGTTMGCATSNLEAVMNRSRQTVVAAVLLVAAAGCGGTRTVTVTVPGPTRTVSLAAPAKSGLGAPRQMLEFGYVKSLTRTGTDYKMRFDPAWFLTGITANTAAAEDGVVAPGQPVPNDNYVVDEGHRLLTFIVPPTTHVTVLTNPGQITSTSVTVAQLADIVHGHSDINLFEPIETGFWVAVSADTVRSLDQQYRA
jgi:hypothetical protein